MPIPYRNELRLRREEQLFPACQRYFVKNRPVIAGTYFALRHYPPGL
jgi:hypothetical protein